MDTRDFKTYWVAKLKDGNCWMTQNLDFDIPDTLYSTTSDVNNTSVTTNTAKVTTPSGWNSTDTTYNAYYDPGDYIYNGPSSNHGQGTNCSANNSSADALSNCNQFTKSAGDMHYHIGNYYSWSAATVKSGDNLTTQGSQALSSICPRGWKLPTSASATAGQFAELLAKYGVNSSLTNGSYAIYKEPLYFTYGGLLGSSTLRNAGYGGYYWSSTVVSNTHVFNLGFNSSVGPDYSNDRHYGFSVRCVAR